MNAIPRQPEPSEGEPRWLLLIHQLPPKPAYLRVRIGRRLSALGAVALKNTVYALPRTDAAREDLTWVLREISEAGGEAIVVAASMIEGLADADVESLFHAARTVDYERIVERAARLDASLRRRRSPPRGAAAELRRLETQLASAVEIDFFEAPGREVVEGRLGAIAARLRSREGPEGRVARASLRPNPREIAGATWVTRRGVHVDRIASAWLIRRFLDPEARFRFVAPRGERIAEGEIRFDMADGEFTHDGDRCTFEVLLDESGLKDLALRAVAEVVHDIDLKDAKFGRPEVAGIARLLEGLARSERDDERRIARGGEIVESLYRGFGRGVR